MQPFAGVTGDAVALADPGKFTWFICRTAARRRLIWPAPAAFMARWFNPRAGGFSEPNAVAPTGFTEFQAPDTNDWALVLAPGRP